MSQSYTLTSGSGSQTKKPRQQTIDFILNYSKALKVLNLTESGMQVGLIEN